MASSFQSAIVKSLVGDLLQIEYDSSKGTEGLLDALAAFDSRAYPRSRTHVSFVEESEIALVTVDSLPIARLLEHYEAVLKDHTGAPRRFSVFQFQSTKGAVLYLYQRLDEDTLIMQISFLAPDAFEDDPYPCRGLQHLHFMLEGYFDDFTSQDIHIILGVLQKFIPAPILAAPSDFDDYPKMCLKRIKHVCSCGHIVAFGNTLFHTTSPVHVKGNVEGKAFFERAAEYIASL